MNSETRKAVSICRAYRSTRINCSASNSTRARPRYIATVETAKHRTFQFLGASVLPDHKLIGIGLIDAYFLGVLSSRAHVTWALAAGGRIGVGNDPVYNKSRCFEPFPFPDAKSELKARIRNLAEQLDAHRKCQQTQHADLAALYGISTGRFNEAVRRNLTRFPADFMFPLANQDLAALRSQIAILKSGRGQHRKYPPRAFTEHGAIMAATVLNSPRATEVSVYVVRAFVRLREILATNEELAAKLEALEQTTEALALRRDTLAANTRVQLKQVFEAIRELMRPLEPKRRPIGFITPEEKKRG